MPKREDEFPKKVIMNDDTPHEFESKSDFVEFAQRFTPHVSKRELNVIVPTIVVGFVLGIVLFVLKFPAVLVVLPFAAGVTALIYGILGGTEGNTLTIKGIKLTSSAAVLGVGTWWLNSQLVDQTLSIDSLLEPPPAEWIAVAADSGAPIRPALARNPDAVLPTADFRTLNIDSLLVRLRTIRPSRAFHNLLEASFSRVERFATDRLPPGSDVPIRSGQRSLRIKTGQYAGGRSEYTLVFPDTALDGSLTTGHGNVFSVRDSLYLVEGEHDHRGESPWARFVVLEIPRPTITWRK